MFSLCSWWLCESLSFLSLRRKDTKNSRTHPQGDVVLLATGLEGERQVVAPFGGFFDGSRLRRGRFVFAPDAGEGGLDLLLKTGDQFAVGGDQRLFGFDLGDDGLLRGERGILASLRLRIGSCG